MASDTDTDPMTDTTPTAEELVAETMLTEREARVLLALDGEKSNAEIADELDMTTGNVRQVRRQALPERLETVIETAEDAERTFRLLAPIFGGEFDDVPPSRETARLRDASETLDALDAIRNQLPDDV